MSRAVDSNSTPVSRIHPAAALIEQRIDGLSSIFQAYQMMTENMPETGSAAKHTDTDTTLARIAAQCELQKDRIKHLRDEFIADRLAQGIAVEEISQVLNLPLSAIERIITQLHPAPDKETPAI